MTAINLVDIQNVKIDKTLPVKERAKSLVNQLGDPYHFKHGDITVHINFTGKSNLEDKVIQLYRNT